MYAPQAQPAAESRARRQGSTSACASKSRAPLPRWTVSAQRGRLLSEVLPASCACHLSSERESAGVPIRLPYTERWRPSEAVPLEIGAHIVVRLSWEPQSDAVLCRRILHEDAVGSLYGDVRQFARTTNLIESLPHAANIRAVVLQFVVGEGDTSAAVRLQQQARTLFGNGWPYFGKLFEISLPRITSRCIAYSSLVEGANDTVSERHSVLQQFSSGNLASETLQGVTIACHDRPQIRAQIPNSRAQRVFAERHEFLEPAMRYIVSLLRTAHREITRAGDERADAATVTVEVRERALAISAAVASELILKLVERASLCSMLGQRCAYMLNVGSVFGLLARAASLRRERCSA